MNKEQISIPLLPEMEKIIESLDETGKNCVILALLDWAEHPYDTCAFRILPRNVYNVFDQCKEMLLQYWKRVGQ